VAFTGAVGDEALLSRRVDGGSLPSDFEWVVGTTIDGEVTLSIVHKQSGRIVLQGF
jgi:hypothetical protein